MQAAGGVDEGDDGFEAVGFVDAAGGTHFFLSFFSFLLGCGVVGLMMGVGGGW